jgi:hypothetical protein
MRRAISPEDLRVIFGMLVLVQNLPIDPMANTANAFPNRMAPDKMEGRVPGLVGHMSSEYGLPKKGERVRDTDRLEVFLKEFRDYEKNNNLPRFIVTSLPEDHTTGTTPGTFTSEACVANVNRIDDFELNEILWRAIKGKDAPFPPAVRRAIAFRSLTVEKTK